MHTDNVSGRDLSIAVSANSFGFELLVTLIVDVASLAMELSLLHRRRFSLVQNNISLDK